MSTNIQALYKGTQTIITPCVIHKGQIEFRANQNFKTLIISSPEVTYFGIPRDDACAGTISTPCVRSVVSKRWFALPFSVVFSTFTGRICSPLSAIALRRDSLVAVE